jgi:trans-aconitate 2-methyltransferase
MSAYQWNASDYAKNSSQQQQWARELIGKLNLRGNERLLDIGCGDGKITAEIASYLSGGQAVGIDNSDEMINLAKGRYSSQIYSNLHFQVEDARRLPFCDEFDVVFSNAALHWVLDHLPVLQGIARSLKCGGRILLQMGGKGNADDVISILDVMIQSKEWSMYFDGFGFPYGFYDPDNYRVWLGDAGLKPTRIELIPKDMTHQGRIGLSSWIRTTWLPYTQRLPESKREDFINEFVNAYMRKFPEDDWGFVHVRMMRLEVEAVKLSDN